VIRVFEILTEIKEGNQNGKFSLIAEYKEKQSRNGWVNIVATVTDKRPRNRGPIPNKSNRIFLYFMASNRFSSPPSLLPVTSRSPFCEVKVTGD
jgi:hypothetical protein